MPGLSHLGIDAPWIPANAGIQGTLPSQSGLTPMISGFRPPLEQPAPAEPGDGMAFSGVERFQMRLPWDQCRLTLTADSVMPYVIMKHTA